MRPIRVATLLLVAVVAAGCGSEPAEEASPADPPTTPTAAQPVGGLPEGPPSPVLRSGGAEQEAARGTYCWEQPADGGLTMATCVDATAPTAEGLPVLPVGSGDRVELRFALDEPPTELTIHLGDQPTGGTSRDVAAAVANPTSFVADVPPGTHYVSVHAAWAQGDGAFYAALDVR